MMHLSNAILIVSVGLVHGMYDASDDVIQLTPDNFHQKVVSSDDLWFVEFYAPWCGHCQSLAPEWKKAAKALKNIVKIGAVDADAHKSLGGQFGVQGFPTIKIFAGNKFKPEDYTGQRTAQGIIDTALSQIRSLVNARLSGKADSAGSKQSKSGGGGGEHKKGDPADVIELTDSNFDSTVMGSEDMWLVEFYAPWCGHCKNLAPHWAQAASELKGKVKLGAVDATVHTVVASRYGVNGFPTIKFFPAGRKEGEVQDYDGGRTADSIVQWATDKFAENVPAPDVLEMTDGSLLEGACQDHQLCVVSFLPQIYDCQSKCRNDYLDILRRLGEKYKKRQWGWVWAEAMAQPDVESAFEIGGFGYPAMAALNARKAKFSVLKGAFSETGINEFLRELAVGRGSTISLRSGALPKVQKTEKWDGKDKELPVEEDIDLSDVDFDEPAGRRIEL